MLKWLIKIITLSKNIIKPFNMKDQLLPSRRTFIKLSSFAGIAALTIPNSVSAYSSMNDDKYLTDNTFLFQGDSITDGNRTRNNDWNHVLGHGYSYLIAARLLFDFPEKKLHFFNRGISGNTVDDLALRWDTDTLAIKPTILSVLIGINDVTRAVQGDINYTPLAYEEGYRALLQRTRKQDPSVKFVICEPFALPVGKVKDKWEDYQREIIPRQETARKLALEFGAVFVPLQDSFNKAAAKYQSAAYWLWDGIHPMPNGHELIAREWIKRVGDSRFISKTG